MNIKYYKAFTDYFVNIDLPSLCTNQHRAHQHSFVIVNDTINIDQVPEELMVVPTLLEAGDVIQMDEIQRDLGGLDEF